MNLNHKSRRFHRFGTGVVLALALIFSLLSLLFGSFTINIRAATGEPIPSATPSFTFPSCQSYLGTPGDKAHFPKGQGHLHQIVGESGKISGGDDVYTLTGGNYLQCFCPEEGTNGIQTNWLKTVETVLGWILGLSGLDWGLDDGQYAAYNSNFNCDPGQSPTPTPTATPTTTPSATPVPTPTATPKHNDGGDGLGCAVNDCSGNRQGVPAIEGTGTGGGGDILGASTMAGAGTFAENLNLAIMIIGGTLSFLGVKNLKKV